MSVNPLSNVDWKLLESRLIWAYSSPVKPTYRDMVVRQRGVVSARRLLRGTAVYIIGRETFRCGPGEWFFTPETTFHQRLSADAENVSLQFRLHWPTGQSLFQHDRLIRIPLRDAEGFDRCCARLCAPDGQAPFDAPHALRGWKGAASDHLQLEACFGQCVAAYAELMTRVGVTETRMARLPPAVAEAVGYIKARSGHQNITVGELARRSGLSVSRFSRLFREQLGKAPSEYVAERRLEQVTLAMLAGAGSLKTLAYGAGFGSPQQFSRWFKAQTKLSPRGWLSQAVPRG